MTKLKLGDALTGSAYQPARGPYLTYRDALGRALEIIMSEDDSDNTDKLVKWWRCEAAVLFASKPPTEQGILGAEHVRCSYLALLHGAVQ
jgi:hypothetical protein